MATQLIDDSQTDPMDDKVLVSWQSMQKPFRERSKDFYSTVLVLAVLVAIVLFFIEGIMPVLVVAAIVFVLFISTKTRPEIGEHSLNTQGVVTGGQKYLWSELFQYWIDRSNDKD